MNTDEPITVYTLHDAAEAEIIKTVLRGAGIRCELDGERQAGLADILDIGVLVRARDADRARRIICRRKSLRGHQPARARH
ncbi:MAG: putative signal transducing protein [Thermoguttaceae bacterium]